MIGGLTYVMVQTNKGNYRCKSISIQFGDDVWEGAWVGDGAEAEDRLLIYSHFNGVYEEDGIKNGRPKYVERSKEDGNPFKVTKAAEIMYCQDIEAWVFRHDNIRTVKEKRSSESNECEWLLRSDSTDNFNIIEVAKESSWSVWKGEIEGDYEISIRCNECHESADCNYNGECKDEVCKCYDETDHFGVFCELKRPCNVIRSALDPNTTLHLAADPYDNDTEWVEIYSRPMYSASMSGIPSGLMKGSNKDIADYSNESRTDLLGSQFDDDDFFQIHLEQKPFVELMKNYTFVLGYTGQRWYGQIRPPGVSWETFQEEEYHGFWNEAFTGLEKDDNATLIISDPTTDASPVGVSFYELHRRNNIFAEGEYDYDYGPYGVLIPLAPYDGAGFFHCNNNDEE